MQEADESQILDGRYEATFYGLPPGEPLTCHMLSHRLLWKTEVGEAFEFETPAPKGGAFRFIAFGDSGNGSNTQAALAERMAGENPDLVIHVGDLIYPAGARKDYLRNFYEPNAELIRTAFFMPSLGNHDCATDQGRPMLREFVLPENGPEGVEPERNYWFDFGDARFVVLDTNPAGDKYAGVLSHDDMKTIVAPWLRKVLTNCDARWKFVYCHHPIYTGSVHQEIEHAYVKEAFLQVLEDTGVDIVFAGHNHLYERTAPMRRDAIVPEGKGVVFVTTGAGGVSRYEEQRHPDYMRVFNDEVFSYTRVDISGDRLQMEQISENGRVLDRYEIVKSSAEPST